MSSESDETPPADVPISGPRAQGVQLDFIRGALRMHFGGEAFAWVALGPIEATQLGVMLIQMAAKMPPPEPPMIVVPGRSGRPS